MKTTVKFRKDGRVVIEVRGETERYRGQTHQLDDCRVMIQRHVTGYMEEIKPGTEGCLVTTDNNYKPGQESAYLHDNPAGLGGNMNANIKRLHGWRGTSNDVAVFAHGWRRVEEYGPVSRGYGVRCVLSRDLRPDKD